MITNEEVGQTLQKIYDSELNFNLASDWDAGIYFNEGPPKEFISRSVAETVDALARATAAKYPDCEFAKWWNQLPK